MKTRYDKLVVVRRAESRIAAAAFATASADLGAQHLLADRLQSALDSLSLTSGPMSANDMAARMELACRMAAAQGVASNRIDAAQCAQHEAGIARRSARRALDAARDIRREAATQVVRQQAVKVVPAAPREPFK